ncbi:hypothetical protein [Microbacterium sp. XT11]|uniref:hypothetical protein n=1 Tax=Microbacterium sp. XT11 TaxID=367477 RepID=UPI00082A7373|nr:hypothetical protein [Microbacterium sp. XT11]
MIAAGLLLLAVGAADLVRQFAPRRWIGYLAVVVVLLLLGSVSDALLPTAAALAVGALWVWSMPDDRPTPLGFWPAVLLALVVVGAVVWLPSRVESGLIGEVWVLRSPFGDVPFDLAVLALGAAVFLLESSNLVVRAALDGEHTWRPVDARAERSGPPASAPAALTDGESPAAPRSGFQGGRLIGPLERMLVLILTLATAYPVLAAMLAAKGIVRFPEISRDGETGARAEYFLVGSLVSWVIALGAAFLVWWAAHS